LQRQVLQLQAIVRNRGKRLEALEEAVSIIAGNQLPVRALADAATTSRNARPCCRSADRRQRFTSEAAGSRFRLFTPAAELWRWRPGLLLLAAFRTRRAPWLRDLDATAIPKRAN
jgi:hypothetical protein